MGGVIKILVAQENPAFQATFDEVQVFGQNPDYITVAGTTVRRAYMVLAGGQVTDHQGVEI